MFKWLKRKTLEQCRDQVKAAVKEKQLSGANAHATYMVVAVKMFTFRKDVANSFMDDLIDEYKRLNAQ